MNGLQYLDETETDDAIAGLSKQELEEIEKEANKEAGLDENGHLIE